MGSDAHRAVQPVSEASHDFPTSLPEERRVRPRQPRLRAVVSDADCVRPGAVRRAPNSSSRFFSAAPSTASASSSRSATPSTTARGPASPSRSRARATARPSISTASSASIRACARSSRSGHSRQLAIVHACGSPDSTRSHFDAQDYMETGTPGVKSTGDGWLNRYLQAPRVEPASPFRAVALTGQLPRMLQGASPAVAMSQIGQFAHPRRTGRRVRPTRRSRRSMRRRPTVCSTAPGVRRSTRSRC